MEVNVFKTAMLLICHFSFIHHLGYVMFNNLLLEPINTASFLNFGVSFLSLLLNYRPQIIVKPSINIMNYQMESHPSKSHIRPMFIKSYVSLSALFLGLQLKQSVN